VLNAFAEHQRRDAYATFAELEAHCECIADLTGCLAAELCGFEDPATMEASRHLGIGLTLTAISRRPLRPGGHRQTDLPADLLERYGARDLDATHTSEALREVLRVVAQGARRHLQRGLDDMPSRDRAAQRSRRALAEMMLAQLRAIERADYAVIEHAPAVTPLRKLWIAWKYRV
jgi:phytoene synthase